MSKLEKLITNQRSKMQQYNKKYLVEHITLDKFNIYFGVGFYARIYPFVDNSLVIGSIELPEKYIGKGLYKKLILELEEYAKENNFRIVIECILSEKLLSWVKKHNYNCYMDSNTYYKDFGDAGRI